MIKITGLGELQKKLADAQEALASLDGTLGSVQFNPEDPASVESAIRSMEAIVDERIAGHSNNDLIVELAESMKAKYREAILDQAAAERLKRQEGK